MIRLFINSVWRYIAVDNNLPFINNDNVGLLNDPGLKSFGSMYLPKDLAYAFSIKAELNSN